MTEKRFQWVYIKDNTLELRDNGIVKVFNNERLEELLNELSDENEQLKQHNTELVNKFSLHFSPSNQIKKLNIFI